MGLFPQSFIEDVRAAADIVVVVQDTVALRRVGNSYKGLCPFHNEKSPSFNVHRDRGFFHCFGCGVGGDAIKFVELRDKIPFVEAVRILAVKFGIPIPEAREREGQEGEREAILNMHEIAAAYFREQLAARDGSAARLYLDERGITAETIEALGYGLAPGYREGLKSRLLKQGFALPVVLKSGLVVQRDNGEVVDRFRNRLMIPIYRETGAIIAFGGRAMLPDQQPKYLNSPETPIYSKSRTLYGMHLSRTAIREAQEAVLVEGYFDFAQPWQAGVRHLVATCGTALTQAQAQTIRRFANRVVLSFDPDTAGQNAAVKSSELLVSEGFDVRVALLPAGQDPDNFVRRSGGAAYATAIAEAQPYLDYLLERAAILHDLGSPDGRRAFVHDMLAVAARIPDAAARDQFADQIAHRGRISEGVIRDEIRKAAVAKKTELPRTGARGTGLGGLKPAERELLAALLNDPEPAVAAVLELDDADFEGLAAAAVFHHTRALADAPIDRFPGMLLGRLNDHQQQWLIGIAARSESASPPVECARALRFLRYERELSDVQGQIASMQRDGDLGEQFNTLLARKYDLRMQLEALKEAGASRESA